MVYGGPGETRTPTLETGETRIPANLVGIRCTVTEHSLASRLEALCMCVWKGGGGCAVQ